MMKVDSDPSRLRKKPRPLPQRTTVAVALLVIAMVVSALVTARSGLSAPTDGTVAGDDSFMLRPATREGEEVLRELQSVERPLYEQPLSGPPLQELPPREALNFGPAHLDERSDAEDALLKALHAPTAIDFALGSDGVENEDAPAGLPDDPKWSGPRPATGQALPEGFSLEGDPAKYARKDRFIRNGASEWPRGVLQHRREPPLSIYELKTGTVIPAVMISGIQSDLPGQILAQVSEPVFDTATGQHLLIPQGSKVVGLYDNQVAFGQKRVLVIWNKVIFPDASHLVLDGMPGADPSGYAGFQDQVKRHIGRRIGSAMLVTAFNVGYELSRRQNQGSSLAGTESAVSSAVGEGIAELGREMVQKEMDVPSTLRIRPGYRFQIMVQKDVPFEAPYEE